MLKKMVRDLEKITKSSKVDLSNCHPAADLLPHIQRANYRTAQWKRAKMCFVDVPSPSQHGWVVENTHIEPVWSEGPILPSRLVDILAGCQDNNDDDDTSDDEPDFDVAFSSNDNDCNN